MSENILKVATPVSIVEDKTTDRENTCLHCCKRLVWSQTYITYVHYVDGTIYYECKKNPDLLRFAPHEHEATCGCPMGTAHFGHCGEW